MFIVDECQAMIESASASSDNHLKRQVSAWLQLVNRALRLYRNAGICLVLCTQSTSGFDIDYSNVMNRIILGQTEEDFLKGLCYGKSFSEEKEEAYKRDLEYLSIRRSGHVVIGDSLNGPTRSLRSAFSSEGETRDRYATMVMEKHSAYESRMVLGGNTELFPRSMPTVPPYRSMLDPVENTDAGDEDDFDYNPYDLAAYPVYIGVTSNDATPIPIAFRTDGMGCSVLSGNTAKLRNLTRSSVLSFLYKTTAYSGRYDRKRVYYFGKEATFRSEIGVIYTRPDTAFIKEYIADYDAELDSYGAVDALVGLYELYEERRRSRGESSDFPPILAVFRGFEWLTGKLAETVKESQAAAKSMTEKPSAPASPEEDPEFIRLFEEAKLSMGSMYSEAMLKNMVLTRYNKQKAQSAEQADHPDSANAQKRVYTESDIVNAVRTLYREGARRNIFVYLGESLGKEYKNICSSPIRLASSIELGKCAIFGCPSESEKGFEEGAESANDSSANTCIVFPSPKQKGSDASEEDMGALARIYKYDASDKAWWNELRDGLKGV